MAEFGRPSSYPFRVCEICRPGTDGWLPIPDNIPASILDACLVAPRLRRKRSRERSNPERPSTKTN